MTLDPALLRDPLLRRNRFGYYLFGGREGVETTTDECASVQEICGPRQFRDYIRPLILAEPVERVLDVGCGTGAGIAELAAEGIDAYGFDLPSVSEIWHRLGRDPERFLSGDALALPFANDCFDIAISTGVIEHIGTADGRRALLPDYQERRAQYARELLRVTKPGGRVLVACPNKSFPVDMQHGPDADASWLRRRLHARTGIHLHPTWGRNHLVSYAEASAMFADASAVEPLPLKGYFGFSSFGRHGGMLRRTGLLAKWVVEHIPHRLLGSPFNPYMLVLVRK